MDFCVGRDVVCGLSVWNWFWGVDCGVDFWDCFDIFRLRVGILKVVGVCGFMWGLKLGFVFIF